MARSVHLLVVVGLALSAHVGARGLVDQPDLALRDVDGGVQVFIAHPRRASLLEGRLPANAGVIRMDALKEFTGCGAFRRPIAVTLAPRDSRLVVLDAAGPEVIECHLDSLQRRVLWAGEPLRAPSSVAFAADGRIAVADRELRGVVMLGDRVEVLRGAAAPLAVRADELGALYVLDGEDGGIAPISTKALDLEASMRARVAQRQSGAFLPLGSEILSFAVFRDVFYIADRSGLRVMLPGTRLSLTISDARPRPGAVAVSERHLAMLDRDGAYVDVLSRPLPSGVLLDHGEGSPNAAWIDLLTHLATRTLLPSRRVPVGRGSSTYEDLLRQHGVLLTADLRPEKLTVRAGSARELFCALNRDQCAAGFPAAGMVEIPQVTPEATLATDTQSLGGRTAREWIDDRVLLSAQKREVNEAYLARYNPDSGATLEEELRRRNMVLATPMSAALAPGAIIRLQDGVESVVSTAGKECRGDAPSITGRTTLPAALTAPQAAVPAEHRAGTAPRVGMAAGSWRRDALPISALQGCAQLRGLDAADLYVIVEALGAVEPRFTPGAAVRGTPARRIVQGGTMVRGRTESNILYVGYRPVALAGLAVGVSTPLADPDKFKPIAASAASRLLDRTSGSLSLPVTRWRAELLLPAPEYYDPQSPLSAIQKRHPGLDLSPQERLKLAAMSDVHFHSLPPGDDLASTIAKSHQRLRDTISYDAELAAASGAEAVYIGIVERSGSVSPGHPAFFDADLQPAWYEHIPDVGLRPHQRPQGTVPAIPLTAKRVVNEAEHGTHVAGIIAARGTSLVKGLLPNTNLYLIPSDTLDRLKKNIELARDGDVYIFNMSLGFPPDSDTVIQDLRRHVGNAWSKSLFVVAAGNGGQNLNAVGAPAPVAWAQSAANVLSVGASDESGDNVLPDHRDDDDTQMTKGSSFGSMFVDLVAPGRLVYSLGKDGYAFACGSSQAAPQVTAAAAMLWSKLRTPEELRARLLYTADWRTAFAGKVWAGLLNVRRALAFPRTNLLTTFSEPSEAHEVVFEGGATFRVDGTETRRTGQEVNFDEDVPVSRILRMTDIGGAQHRVLFMKRDGTLTIVEGNVSGKATCRSMSHFDHTRNEFGATPHPRNFCRAGIDANQVLDYVASTPTTIRFQ